MSGAETVHVAQGLAALVWAGVAAYFAPAFLRLIRRRASVLDVFAALLSSVGVVQVGFTVRWYVWPHAIPTMSGDELSFWLALYATSSLQAVGFLIAALAHRWITRP